MYSKVNFSCLSDFLFLNVIKYFLSITFDSSSSFLLLSSSNLFFSSSSFILLSSSLFFLSSSSLLFFSSFSFNFLCSSSFLDLSVALVIFSNFLSSSVFLLFFFLRVLELVFTYSLLWVIFAAFSVVFLEVLSLNNLANGLSFFLTSGVGTLSSLLEWAKSSFCFNWIFLGW